MISNSRYSLLTFTRNNIDEGTDITKRLYDKVDEIVIIDSSTKPLHEELIRRTAEFSPKIFHVIPTRIIEPLRTFGLSKIESEFVIYLDSGELISDKLLDNLANFVQYDSYSVRRIEMSYGSFNWQTRLFRKSSVVTKGYVQEMFSTPGKAFRLKDKDMYISQYSDLGNPKKRRDYLILDVLDRPLTYNYLISRIPMMKDLGISFLDYPISGLFFNLYKLVFYYYMVRYKSSARELIPALEYLSLHQRIYDCLDKRLYEELKSIRKDVEDCGGPIRYLQLDNAEYVESLNKDYLFDSDGIMVYLYLLNYRHQNGKCATVIPPEGLESNPLYVAMNKSVTRTLGRLELK